MSTQRWALVQTFKVVLENRLSEYTVDLLQDGTKYGFRIYGAETPVERLKCECATISHAKDAVRWELRRRECSEVWADIFKEE